ncbi:MAG: F0F1-type ATP synthase membrane subunit b/b', partial [Flavobacteriales bacterium]
ASALVPLTIATMAPFFLFAFLLVSMVYKSPLEKAVSSRDRLASKFFANNSQSVACCF